MRRNAQIDLTKFSSNVHNANKRQSSKTIAKESLGLKENKDSGKREYCPRQNVIFELRWKNHRNFSSSEK